MLVSILIMIIIILSTTMVRYCSNIDKKNNIEKNFQRMKEFDKRLHKKDKTFFYTDFVVEKVIKYGNN